MDDRALQLLGPLALHAPESGALLRTRKAVALLAYLALQPQRRARREQLASMLWPRVDADAARTSLRQLLSALRKARAAHAPLLDAEGDWLKLADDIDVDVQRFESAAASDDPARAAEALGLYRGALLDGAAPIDSADFDDWLEQERARLARIAVGAMERVAVAALERRVPLDAGTAAVERAITLDPYNEQAHRLLMQLQSAGGRPDLALRHYAALADALRRDLQVAPDTETQALHDRLRDARRPVSTASPSAPPPARAIAAAPPPPFALPAAVVPARQPALSWSSRYAGPALIGVAAALILAATIGLHRWIRPAAQAPHVSRLFPVAADPMVEQRPAISPDGARVIYTARLQDRRNVDLYMSTVGDMTPLRLTTDPEIDDNAVWTPDGSAIAFTRSSRDGHTPCAILIMPVPGGQERLVGHCRSAISSRMSWAPDGRTLYYSDSDAVGGVTRIYRLDATSGAVAAVTNPPSSIMGDTEPEISRDGRTLAFLRMKAWQSVEVQTLDLASGEQRSLSHDAKTVWGVTWGPKDQGLIFSSDRGGDTGLWWVAREGGNPVRLALGDFEYRTLSMARNRDRLVYEGLKDHAEFRQVPRDATPATEPQVIQNLRTNLFDRFYVESHSGRAAFVSIRAGPENLWVADRGQAPHQITFTQDSFYQEPAWSPDGRWIAYVGVASDPGDIFLISGDGGRPRALTRDAAIEQSPMWAADGRTLYYTSRQSGAWRIWRLDPFARRAPAMVSGNGPRAVRPSPDGKYLYYVLDGQAGVRRRALAPDGAALVGAEEMVVASLHPSDWRNWWLADGALFYARRSGGDPAGVIVRHDLSSGAERDMADATDLLWSASFWARPDGSLVLTHRDLQIDVNGVDF